MVLFADARLVARIERAEAALLRDAADRVGQRLPAGALFRRDLAGGVAAFTEPGAPLNKVCGLGFEGPVDEAALGDVEGAFAARGEPVRIEVASLADPALAEQLSRRGYRLAGFENVLGMPLPAVGRSTPVPHVEVYPSDAPDIERWLDVVVGGFSAPDGDGVGPPEVFVEDMLRPIVRDFAQVPGVVRLMARRDGKPAGGASMRLGEGIAQFCGAATLREHRRRGVQSALLAERLALAAAAGCEVAVITTQPGSKSMQNAQRHGFQLLYVRAVLLRS